MASFDFPVWPSCLTFALADSTPMQIKVRFSDKTVKVNTEKQIADLTANMVRVDGSVRVRDEKGRDVFWKFENGMSYMGFADAALSNELMRVMPGAVERLILDKVIIPKNPCRKETRHPLHLQPTDKEKFGTLHLGAWANRYKTSLGMSVWHQFSILC
jgi:hypothetical protein